MTGMAPLVPPVSSTGTMYKAEIFASLLGMSAATSTVVKATATRPKAKPNHGEADIVRHAGGRSTSS